MSLAIETNHLTKTYKSKSGPIDVVKDLNLQVDRGEIFGFLGPNGAGKTTTIKILLGIIYGTSGTANVLGEEVGDINVHRKLSYLPEKPYYYEHMTGLEIMTFYASLFGIRDRALCESLLQRVNLTNDMNRPISQYSKGMQQRVGLAQSLINDPELLFLDEPTGGLDPIAHIEIRDLILKFREEGRTVFISSHELSDVERICDRVAIINKGEMVHQGRLDDLLAGGRIEITIDGVDKAFADSIRHDDTVVSFKGERLIVDMPDIENPNELIDSVRTKNGSIVSVIPRRKRLEDLFLESVAGDNLLKGRSMSRMTDDHRPGAAQSPAATDENTEVDA
ncbi:ABC transporter ATP-binding protein [Kamptonema cortianum]|nr:ABC transporter ATP-binding protein [Geitlerinema splendidum]MDK3158552.1 ABC transporter ATP-binding protein [Kamptonema cortianum]